MSTSHWRSLLLALCTFALIELGVTCWMQAERFAAIPGLVCNCGIPGAVAVEQSTAVPFVRRLLFTPDNPLSSAGIRSGDLVDLRGLPPWQRYRFETRWWWLGEKVTVPVVHSGRTAEVTLIPQRFRFPVDWWVANVGLVWMVMFAGLIAWRRANSVEARILALLLMCYVSGLTFESQNWVTPFPRLDAFLNAVAGYIYYGGIALLATHALLFARPAGLWRRMLTGAAYVVVGAGGTLYALSAIGAWTAIIDPVAAWYQGTLGQLFVNILPYALPVLCCAFGIGAAKGMERDRIAWAELPLACLFTMQFAQAIPDLLGPGVLLPRILEVLVNGLAFVAPLGLTYSLLNRRILDVGFAVNRAMVFSAVSIVIVGVFVLFEWVLGDWFSSTSHTANLAISAAVALSLGLSVRIIHARVDRALDAVFFRKRHEDEQALRAFAREAAYISDGPTLLARTSEILQQRAGASTVTFVLEQDAFAPAGENDRAIVALRAWHKVVDLHDLKTALHGEFAFPMVSRGRLVGALVIGSKASGESYAPDESEAITSIAHGVGGALDILQTRERGNQEPMLESFQQAIILSIREGFTQLAERLESRETL